MSKVTSKLQVTLPKAVADQLGIKPGDEIDWEIAGEVIRVIPVSKRRKTKREKEDFRTRLRLFDQATQRERERESTMDPALLEATQTGRGWTREDLYNRGRAG
jgi:AbrB family looped-hinge helix DNA binding protein